MSRDVAQKILNVLNGRNIDGSKMQAKPAMAIDPLTKPATIKADFKPSQGLEALTRKPRTVRKDG